MLRFLSANRFINLRSLLSDKIKTFTKQEKPVVRVSH